MKNIDSISHVKGESVYVNDIPELTGTLHAVPVYSKHAHAKILHLDLLKAKESKGIVDILTATEIPGENPIGGIIPDEPLFCQK